MTMTVNQVANIVQLALDAGKQDTAIMIVVDMIKSLTIAVEALQAEVKTLKEQTK